MADVGQQKHIAEMQTEAHIPSRIPAEKLPASVPAEVAQLMSTQGSRPDILMLNEEDGTQSFYIIEIKYCTDTAPQGQESRAATQHLELQKTQQADTRTRVFQITLLFGVTGAIYKDTKDKLEGLGIQPTTVKSLLHKLHMHAVKSLHTIWKGRAVLLADKRQPGVHHPPDQPQPAKRRRKNK